MTNPAGHPTGHHWAVAQIFSKRAHLIRAAYERDGNGTLVPTYVRSWFTDGKPSSHERQLLPGYLLVKVSPASWGELTADEYRRLGVIRVLANNGRASAVRDDEMARLTLGHAMGLHNEISAGPEVRRPRRRRRPRAGRRWRQRQQGATS